LIVSLECIGSGSETHLGLRGKRALRAVNAKSIDIPIQRLASRFAKKGGSICDSSWHIYTLCQHQRSLSNDAPQFLLLEFPFHVTLRRGAVCLQFMTRSLWGRTRTPGLPSYLRLRMRSLGHTYEVLLAGHYLN
jgi:hypothetical protein